MSFEKILWLWELAFSWKTAFIINFNIVQKCDRQDTKLISELRMVGYGHYVMLDEMRIPAFLAVLELTNGQIPKNCSENLSRKVLAWIKIIFDILTRL